MQNHLEIVRTGDGSKTVLDKTRNTTYHSMNGAITESLHVFIDAGLKHLLDRNVKKLRILEMGFGTGLNALLSYLEVCNSDHEVAYFGIEADPLPYSIINQLDYPAYLKAGHARNVFMQMHAAANMTEKEFTLTVLQGKAEDIDLPIDNTLVYYDAFGPGDQSELWDLGMLGKITRSMAPGGVLVTYCAQGQFKRNLKQLGCEVESLPGPPGKREMVRATLRKT